MNFSFLQVNSGDFCKTKVMLLEADLNTCIYSVHRLYTYGFETHYGQAIMEDYLPSKNMTDVRYEPYRH